MNSDLYMSYKVIESNEGQTVPTISSREVAEMMGTRHDNLMIKIEKHTSILEKVTDLKIKVSDLWQLSSYKDSTGRTLKEYQVKKKGCEFLAHKTTGEKGDLFTIKYMDKFEAMEKALKEIDKPSYMIDDPIERAEKWIVEQKEKKLLQDKLEKNSKMINQIAASKNSLLVREVAKVLSNQHGIVIGEKKLYQKLRDWGWVFQKTTEAKQEAIRHGYLEVVEGTRESTKGVFTFHTTRVTGKGQRKILEKLLEELENKEGLEDE